jgi:hypothetical protein
VENVHEMTGRNFVQYGQRHLVNFSYAAGGKIGNQTRELKIRTQSNLPEQFWKLRKTGTMKNVCFKETGQWVLFLCGHITMNFTLTRFLFLFFNKGEIQTINHQKCFTSMGNSEYIRSFYMNS